MYVMMMEFHVNVRQLEAFTWRQEQNKCHNSIWSLSGKLLSVSVFVVLVTHRVYYFLFASPSIIQFNFSTLLINKNKIFLIYFKLFCGILSIYIYMGSDGCLEANPCPLEWYIESKHMTLNGRLLPSWPIISN